MSLTKKMVSTPLSFDDLNKMYYKATKKNLKIIVLNTVSPKDSIDSLFDRGCFVLYIPVLSEYNGHFTSFFRTKNGIYFMDSYGNTPKKLFEIIDRNKNKTTIFDIIKKSGIPFYCNNIDYQTQSESITDCGYYSVINCIWYTQFMQKGKSYDLNTFYSLLTNFMRTRKIVDADIGIVEVAKQIR